MFLIPAPVNQQDQVRRSRPVVVYQMHEACLTLDNTWQDQSVNVLVPAAAAKGVNLVVARDTMPLGMTFADYLEQQKAVFQKELTEFELMMDSPGTVDRRQAHFLEFSWKNNGNLLQQMIIVVQHKDRILSLTGTIPGGGDNQTREFLLAAMTSLKFNPEDQRIGHEHSY
jgi:hypothetical protein